MAKKKKSKSRSSIRQHKQVGKTLIPPLMTVPNIGFQSWAKERMPEMLWACLVISVFPRLDALSAFRVIAEFGFNYRDKKHDFELSLYQTKLAELPQELITHIVKTVTKHPLGYAALRPLLLFDTLPGRELWEKLLNAKTQNADWKTLSDAVLKTLDHQSQESTDVRWLRLIFKIALGDMYYPSAMKEKFEELIYYPNKGDMRSVRPFIRAGEMSVDMNAQHDKRWSQYFWKECLEKTECNPAIFSRKLSRNYDFESLFKDIQNIKDYLIAHWFKTLDSTDVDAKHDAAFGFVFFGIAVLLEIVSGLNGFGITGRSLLRTLVECRITLSFLCKSSSNELWSKFRAYGTGQAKLSLLKIDESDEEKPDYVTLEVLEQLCNEDFFDEYVKIDLGHWCGLDLRKMAEKSGTKDDYDLFYGWPSGFVHGHWEAQRDTCMAQCLNPLHRLHRVPLPDHRLLENTVPDGIRLINSMLDDLSTVFPGFLLRIELSTQEK